MVFLFGGVEWLGAGVDELTRRKSRKGNMAHEALDGGMALICFCQKKISREREVLRVGEVFYLEKEKR